MAGGFSSSSSWTSDSSSDDKKTSRRTVSKSSIPASATNSWAMSFLLDLGKTATEIKVYGQPRND